MAESKRSTSAADNFSSDEDEDPADYKKGGYHRVAIGDV